MAFLTGQPAPSARPQIVVPGMMPMLSPTSTRMSRSSSRPPPAADALDHLEHPAGPLAARRALAARLVGEEPAGVVQQVDHDGLVVDHRDRGGAQAEQPTLAGRCEIERRVELVGRAKPMLMPPGLAALVARPFQTPAAVACRSARGR